MIWISSENASFNLLSNDSFREVADQNPCNLSLCQLPWQKQMFCCWQTIMFVLLKKRNRLFFNFTSQKTSNSKKVGVVKFSGFKQFLHTRHWFTFLTYILAIVLYGIKCVSWSLTLCKKIEFFQNYIRIFMTNYRLSDQIKIKELFELTKLVPIMSITKKQSLNISYI